MHLTFAGAAGTVTGSKYVVEVRGRKLLVDCGLFQGLKELRLRNWAAPPFDPRAIQAVLLTHAHIDHAGYIPLLVKQGFTGHVLSTRATRDLCEILLRDSGHLQEEEAAYANRRRFSKHSPALPLYSESDAEEAMARFLPVDWENRVELGGGVACRFLPAGHILGADMIVLEDGERSILFSGDLGRAADPILRAPVRPPRADWLVVESTYGDRVHPSADPESVLASTIDRTVARGGVVVVPAFCVGRAQQILYDIVKLKAARRVPDVPVYVNSPMARDVTDIYARYQGEHRLSTVELSAMCRATTFVNSVQDSKRLNARSEPMIIIAGSGMATGGRVLHHIHAFAPDARNTLLFVGYQAAGTRGASIVGGAPCVKLHGEEVPIRAEVVSMGGLSAHADSAEILAWLRGFEEPPKHTFVTHGEPEAARALANAIRELGWKASVPDYLGEAELAAF